MGCFRPKPLEGFRRQRRAGGTGYFAVRPGSGSGAPFRCGRPGAGECFERLVLDDVGTIQVWSRNGGRRPNTSQRRRIRRSWRRRLLLRILESHDSCDPTPERTLRQVMASGVLELAFGGGEPG